jgi:predicted AlkP superfamily pyrophosphatase or phosphodiesterase
MFKHRFRSALIGLSLFTLSVPAFAGQSIDRALLISIDGLHALDVENYIESHPNSAMAELSRHGVTYSNASTPSLSDSFPGLLALVTGGSPVSHGVFYDVSYSRELFDPSNTTCAGKAGNTTVFDESIDNYNLSNVSLDSIDPTKLPNGFDKNGNCVRIYPHDFIKTNTIFEVVKAHNGRTAWADKHPAYDLVNGPSGQGVDDLYTPEITNVNGFDATVSVICTAQNDRKKVNAILNEIQGKNHSGTAIGIVPTVFGMNFQAVSVGQKLAHEKTDPSCIQSVADAVDAAALKDTAGVGHPGGYIDASGTPTDVLEYGFAKTDQALGDMIKGLKAKGIYESTLIIVTAKHGQSPINPLKVNKAGHFADIVAALAIQQNATTDPGVMAIADANACSTGPCGMVQDDDIALIWLKDQSKSQAVASYLNANSDKLYIQYVLSGESLTLRFNDPKHDNRTPDLIVQPEYGTIYTGSGKKNAEHGGLSVHDTNVGLIVSNPHLVPETIKTPVASSQVAPTILKSLGIDPNSLQSVVKEQTQPLPGLILSGGN